MDLVCRQSHVTQGPDKQRRYLRRLSKVSWADGTSLKEELDFNLCADRRHWGLFRRLNNFLNLGHC